MATKNLNQNEKNKELYKASLTAFFQNEFMKNKILIYETSEHNIKIDVKFEGETFWLSLNQIATLFERNKSVISRHLSKIFSSNELDKNSVVAKNATTATDGKTYRIDYYNLDVILSVGYRVNSKRGTQFRQWATQRLKDFLVTGYAINQKRLAEKEIEVNYLKTGIQILSSALKNQVESLQEAKSLTFLLEHFSRGLMLLDDYDHNSLDKNGNHDKVFKKTNYNQFKLIINAMKADISSTLFGLEKDNSFKSSISQIYQTFDKKDLYPSLEEKAAALLYLIVKNHSFIDGNKRIAAACFIFFLEQNNLDVRRIVSNDGLAALTLYIAASEPKEMKTVLKLIITILNRGNNFYSTVKQI